MKLFIVVLALACSMWASAQEPISLQEKHNQFLGDRSSQFREGDHSIIPLLLHNCKNKIWDISIYILENKFSFYLEMDGITLHQEGSMTVENGQCQIATCTKIVQAREDRGWGMASCNVCGNKDCYPCTANGPSSCAVFRFRECHQEGCRKFFTDPGHLTIDHTWRKISRRSSLDFLECNISYIFSLGKMGMEIEGDYAKIVPFNLEKFPIALMECGARIIPSIQRRLPSKEIKPCIMSFIQAQRDRLLPLFLCEVLFRADSGVQNSTAFRGCTFHVWDNGAGATCKCYACGETRDSFHKWNNCTCGRCGKVQNVNHLWDWNGSGQTCKCWTCGTVRDSNHNWVGNTCGRCGKKK